MRILKVKLMKIIQDQHYGSRKKLSKNLLNIIDMLQKRQKKIMV